MNNLEEVSWDEIYDLMCGEKEKLISFLKWRGSPAEYEYEFNYTDTTQTEYDFNIEELF